MQEFHENFKKNIAGSFKDPKLDTKRIWIWNDLKSPIQIHNDLAGRIVICNYVPDRLDPDPKWKGTNPQHHDLAAIKDERTRQLIGPQDDVGGNRAAHIPQSRWCPKNMRFKVKKSILWRRQK